MGAFILREGDKVMQIRNNYDKMVFNGDIGRVVKIDQMCIRDRPLYRVRIIWHHSFLEDGHAFCAGHS